MYIIYAVRVIGNTNYPPEVRLTSSDELYGPYEPYELWPYLAD